MLALLSRLIGNLPLTWAIRLGRLFGWIWYTVIPIRRREALRNVDRVFGGTITERVRRQLVRKNFIHLATYAVELLRIPQLTPERAHALTERQGFHHIEEAFARGKGVILVSAHVGNIDLAGTSMAITGVPVAVVAKDMGAATRGFVAAVRARTGVVLIPPRRSKEQIRSILAANGMVVLLVDQHLARHRAIVCDFFGQKAATSPAPARFARETGATIVPGVTYRLPSGKKHVLRFLPPFELENPFDDLAENIRHDTQRLNQLIEGWVREFPEQWLWPHRRWKVQDHPDSW